MLQMYKKIYSKGEGENNEKSVVILERNTIGFITSVSKTIRKPPLVKAQTALKKTKKIKYGENDFQYGGWNSYTLQ